MKPTLVILTKSHAKEQLEDGYVLGNYPCQLAATIINPHYRTRVFQVDPSTNPDSLIETIKQDMPNPVFAFSTIRHKHFRDFNNLSREIRNRGYLTFLAGAYSNHRYVPEVGSRDNKHRFQGNLDCYDFCYNGPAEGAIPVLARIEKGKDYADCAGITTVRKGKIVTNTRKVPNLDNLVYVDWENITDLCGGGPVTAGTVIAQWGCPYGKMSTVTIDPPFGIDAKQYQLESEGCTFCSFPLDVPRAYNLPVQHVRAQIANLQKYGINNFFLIHQNPFQILSRIMEKGIDRIRLMSRVDYIKRRPKSVERVIKQAQDYGITLDLFCVGFESFTQKILNFFNKGITVEDNFMVAELLNDLEDRYDSLEITPGPHGIIIPTPWHSVEDLELEVEILGRDLRIVPFFFNVLLERHLRISHQDQLAEWVRFLEPDVKYKRDVAGIIQWNTEASQQWPGFPYADVSNAE